MLLPACIRHRQCDWRRRMNSMTCSTLPVLWRVPHLIACSERQLNGTQFSTASVRSWAGRSLSRKVTSTTGASRLVAQWQPSGRAKSSGLIHSSSDSPSDSHSQLNRCPPQPGHSSTSQPSTWNSSLITPQSRQERTLAPQSTFSRLYRIRETSFPRTSQIEIACASMIFCGHPSTMLSPRNRTLGLSAFMKSIPGAELTLLRWSKWYGKS
jgi:hypothetical protein